jgi:nucleoside-diphosphate-sugar epimerase
VSTADACTRMCRLAGLDRIVVDVPPSDDPELLEVFGPTLIAIAKKAAKQTPERKTLEDSKTFKRLGYRPITLDEGLAQTLDWFRAVGKVDPP